MTNKGKGNKKKVVGTWEVKMGRIAYLVIGERPIVKKMKDDEYRGRDYNAVFIDEVVEKPKLPW